MDNTDRYLKETFKVEQAALFKSSKLQNIEKMQWLKNTSYSPDFGKKRDVSKKIYFDTATKTVNAVLLKDNIEAYSAKKSDEYHVTDKHTNNLSKDSVKSDENIQKEDIITLISKTNKVISQEKKEEEILSIVESIVTAQVEAEFSTGKKQTVPSNMLQNNESVTEPQTSNKELASTKQSDGNNNSTSVTLCATLSKEDNEHKIPSKVTEPKSTKSSIEANNKDVQNQSGSVPKIGTKNKDNALKMREKPPLSSTNFKKTVVNAEKSPSDRFKTVKSHDCVKKQQYLKHKRETQNSTPKSSNTEKRNCEMESNKTTDNASPSKPVNKDKAMPRQHQVKKRQESLRKSAIKQAVDKNKQEITSFKKEEATLLKLCDLPSSESARKEKKIIDEKPYQNNGKVTGSGNDRRGTTSVYKNSSSSRISQNKDTPRNTDENATSYRRNRSSLPYTFNNSRVDRFNSGRNTQRRAIVKKEYTTEYHKSNSKIEEHSANNIEKQQDERYHDNQNQSNQLKSESKNSELSNRHEVDAVNDKHDVESVKAKTDLKENDSSVNVDGENTEWKQNTEPVITSGQCEKVVDKSKVDTTQKQNIQANEKTKNTRTNSPKHSVNSHSNKFTAESSRGSSAQNEQLSRVDNVEYTKNTSQQFVSKQTIWSSQTFDNAVQRSVAMNVQQTVQNMQYSLQQQQQQQQQTQERNKMRMSYQQPSHVPSWEPSRGKAQQYSNSNAIQYSQAPNTYDTQYDYNAAVCSDNSGVNASALVPVIGMSVDNSNTLYRYEPSLQHRLVAATSSFSGLSPEMDEAGRWNPSVHNRQLYVHVDQSYNNSAPAQHTYNSPDQQSYSSTPEHSMHVYNANLGEMYGAQATSCVSPIVYAPSPCMQPWNPQLQYSIPVFYASPCASYTVLPVNQLNDFDNVDSVHDQQFKYVPYSQPSNYAKDARDDATNRAIQMRNTADNIKLNQYYKQCHDNCRFVYDAPQYATPMSRSGPQNTDCISASDATHHCNAYLSSQSSQRYHNQNYATTLKKQMQDFGCDDKDPDDIPPIISPKEFVTRSGEFTPRACNQEFTNPDVGYRVPQLQKYNGGLRRNSSFHRFPREYTSSVSIGRGKNNKKV